jgi:hypothetical protein
MRFGPDRRGETLAALMRARDTIVSSRPIG